MFESMIRKGGTVEFVLKMNRSTAVNYDRFKFGFCLIGFGNFQAFGD